MCMSMGEYVYVYVYVSAVAHEIMASDSLELESGSIVSHLTWVLWTNYTHLMMIMCTYPLWHFSNSLLYIYLSLQQHLHQLSPIPFWSYTLQSNAIALSPHREQNTDSLVMVLFEESVCRLFSPIKAYNRPPRNLVCLSFHLINKK